MRFGPLLLASVLLSGCAETAMPPGAAPAAIPGAPGVTMRADQSHRYVAIVGLKLQHAPPFLGVPETNYFVLRSWLDRDTGEAHHQLYVSDSYAGPERNWDTSRDDAGAPLSFVSISHNQIGCERECAWVEDFAAAIPDELSLIHI